MSTPASKPPVMLDGKALATEMRGEISARARRLGEAGRPPGLAVLLVGQNPASHLYVGMKEKACLETGIASVVLRLPEDTTEATLISRIAEFNGRSDIHGILVQIPLPKRIDPAKVVESIHPSKDVDGLHPENLGRLLAGQDGFVPCTPLGIMKLLARHRIPLAGKEAVVVGRSTIVGKPLAVLLLREHATVTLCHSRTSDLAAHTSRADILVAAIGKPRLITADMVKEGAVVVDVGTNRDAAGKSCGDVDFAAVSPKVSAITPVPGGVGPMTITMLLHNTVLAAERAAGIQAP